MAHADRRVGRMRLARRSNFPGASIDKEFADAAPDNPVADAYRAWQAMPYDAPSWAMAAALYAARPKEGYFKLSGPGTIRWTTTAGPRSRLRSRAAHTWSTSRSRRTRFSGLCRTGQREAGTETPLPSGGCGREAVRGKRPIPWATLGQGRKGNGVVGRTPWSAADAPVGLLLPRRC